MIRVTLVTDGASDAVLLPILRWLFGRLTSMPVELRWGDLRGLPDPPTKLERRIALALRAYPCDILFVHRDAEKRPSDERYAEIDAAREGAVPVVGVVPVRMQEAWLLLDEQAIREAAGRPSGKTRLDLPDRSAWESLPDPKRILHDRLRLANGSRGRRAKRFNPSRAAHRLAELIEDWSPLRELAAFRRLEEDTRAVFLELGLPSSPDV